jgi:hAT family C-terminal dimerisation region
LYQHFDFNETIQKKVKDRWDFLSTECSGISYMLNPKFAVEGFFVDNDRIDIMKHVNDFVTMRFPELGEKAEEELVQFVSQMSSLAGSRKESVMKMDAKSYWNVIGRHSFPTLYLCAREVNEMISSSAASERVWSIYRFIHSRLRNRLSNEKVEKLAFIYVNCAILDKADQTDYIADIGAILSVVDCE